MRPRLGTKVTSQHRIIVLVTSVTILCVLTLYSSVSEAATKAAAYNCPCGLWGGGAVPAVAAEDDPDAVEIGVKFRSAVGGYVTGLRFYKSPPTTRPTAATPPTGATSGRRTPTGR